MKIKIVLIIFIYLKSKACRVIKACMCRRVFILFISF